MKDIKNMSLGSLIGELTDSKIALTSMKNTDNDKKIEVVNYISSIEREINERESKYDSCR
jgi:hypothetical protein